MQLRPLYDRVIVRRTHRQRLVAPAPLETGGRA